jgi:tryptophan halogenase
MAAALIAKVIGRQVAITLVESEEIGIIGVGEATIPPIQTLNSVLGIDEAEFLRETKATVKLAIRFENWGAVGDSYYHTFGTAGRNLAFCPFHHFWARARGGDGRKLLGLRSQLPVRPGGPVCPHHRQ